MFIKPRKQYYFGKIRFGTPYMYPIGFNPHVLSIRKLTPRTNYDEYVKDRPWLENTDGAMFSNLPMVRRCKDWIVKLFGNYYWIAIGWPWAVKYVKLGWKDKFGTPRYEWQPQFHIFFLGLQFVIWWNAPDNDKYYEMLIWCRHYCDNDIQKAEETWPWTSGGKSTWNKNYIL